MMKNRQWFWHIKTAVIALQLIFHGIKGQNHHEKQVVRILSGSRKSGSGSKDETNPFRSQFRIVYTLNADFEPFSDCPDDIVEAFQPQIEEAGDVLQDTMNSIYEEVDDPFDRMVTDVQEIDGMSTFGTVIENGTFVEATKAPVETNPPTNNTESGTISPTFNQTENPSTETGNATTAPSQSPTTTQIETGTMSSASTKISLLKQGTVSPTSNDTETETGTMSPTNETGSPTTATDGFMRPPTESPTSQFTAGPSIQAHLQMSGQCVGCPRNQLLTNEITDSGDRMLLEDAEGKLSIDQIVLRMNMEIENRNLTNAFGSIVGVAALEELEEITDSPTVAPTISPAPSDFPTGAPTVSGDASTKGLFWTTMWLTLLCLLCIHL